MSKKAINITILDKEYHIGAPAGEEKNLIASAQLLNDSIHAVRTGGGNIIGSEKIAVLAALNLASEVLKLQEQQSEYQQTDNHIQALSEKIHVALNKIELT